MGTGGSRRLSPRRRQFKPHQHLDLCRQSPVLLSASSDHISTPHQSLRRSRPFVPFRHCTPLSAASSRCGRKTGGCQAHLKHLLGGEQGLPGGVVRGHNAVPSSQTPRRRLRSSAYLSGRANPNSDPETKSREGPTEETQEAHGSDSCGSGWAGGGLPSHH